VKPISQRQNEQKPAELNPEWLPKLQKVFPLFLHRQGEGEARNEDKGCGNSAMKQIEIVKERGFFEFRKDG
jgi:hypothetical protein